MSEDYCELCDLPLSTCVHGNPPAPPPPAPAATRPTRTPGSSVRTSSITSESVTSPRSSSRPAPAKAPVSRKWTPSESFRPHIMRILTDAEGRLDADDLMLELEVALDELLTPGDRESSPQGGARWHVAVRKQRKALIDEGLLVPAQPGVWELTPEALSRD